MRCLPNHSQIHPRPAPRVRGARNALSLALSSSSRSRCVSNFLLIPGGRLRPQTVLNGANAGSEWGGVVSLLRRSLGRAGPWEGGAREEEGSLRRLTCCQHPGVRCAGRLHPHTPRDAPDAGGRGSRTPPRLARAHDPEPRVHRLHRVWDSRASNAFTPVHSQPHRLVLKHLHHPERKPPGS